MLLKGENNKNTSEVKAISKVNLSSNNLKLKINLL